MMSKNNFVIGVMFIAFGLSIIFNHLIPVSFKVLGIVCWSIFVLQMGVKAFKRNNFSMSSCIMIAIASGLLLDQIPQLKQVATGTYIKPLFLLAIGLSFAFGQNRFSNKRRSNNNKSLNIKGLE